MELLIVLIGLLVLVSLLFRRRGDNTIDTISNGFSWMFVFIITFILFYIILSII